MKVKTILVSQPEPSSEKSPYNRLQNKHKLTIDFRPFIHVEGVDAKEVRQQKIDFKNYNNVFMFNNFIYFLYLDLREYLAKCVYLIHLALLRYILFEHCITVFVLGLVQNLN